MSQINYRQRLSDRGEAPAVVGVATAAAPARQPKRLKRRIRNKREAQAADAATTANALATMHETDRATALRQIKRTDATMFKLVADLLAEHPACQKTEEAGDGYDLSPMTLPGNQEPKPEVCIFPDAEREEEAIQEMVDRIEETQPTTPLGDDGRTAQINAIGTDGCPDCGQVDHGQTGEHPCATCGLPMTHDATS
jgi:hypothetical protein